MKSKMPMMNLLAYAIHIAISDMRTRPLAPESPAPAPAPSQRSAEPA